MKLGHVISIIIFLITWLWCVFVSSYIGLCCDVGVFMYIMIMAVMWICCMCIGLYVGLHTEV